MPTNSRPGSLAAMWREEIESYPIGSARLGEGQAAFARGAVSQFRGEKGRLLASVYDASTVPHEVSIEIESLAPEVWQRLEQWLALHDWDHSELEGGRVSTALSMQLEAMGVSLVPAKYKQIAPTCTCKDWLQPCRHALAVLFAFGLEIEHDPQVLLRIRGADDPAESGTATPAQPSSGGEALAQETEAFWGHDADFAPLAERIGLPEQAPVRKYLKRLGPLPFWGGSFDLSPLLRAVYDPVRARRVRESVDLDSRDS